MPLRINFEYKSETDLYELLNLKTACLSLDFSRDGEYFAMYCKDKHYRIYKFTTGKIIKEYNESLKFYIDNYQNVLKSEQTRLEKQDFDKRLILEKEIEKYIDNIPSQNIQFDETNQYI